MLLSAGFGARMQPLTQTTPKPLVCIDGRSLLERALDALEKAQIKKAVANVHHLVQQICDHFEKERRKRKLDIVVSDERNALLDSAGGVVKALDELGRAPFFILNSDTFWSERQTPNLLRLARYFESKDMDLLLLTVDRQQACGHGRGDFLLNGEGRLTRSGADDADAVIYAGALLINPAIFSNAETTSHSLNLYFDRAIAEGRLFGLPLEGRWYTVDTAEMIDTVEKRLCRQDECTR